VSDDRLDAEVLGRLLVALQTLDILPDVIPMAAFLQSALGEVPGITSAFVCLDTEILPADQTAIATLDLHCPKAAGPLASAPLCVLKDRPDIELVPMRTPRRAFGCLQLIVNDQTEFEAYKPFLVNIAHMVATILENREIDRSLAEANAQLKGLIDELEDRVKDRTMELEEAEERYRTTLATLPDAISALRAVRGEAGTIVDFEWTYANPAQAAQHPQTPLVGARLLDIHPECRKLGLFDALCGVIKTGEQHIMEVQGAHPHLGAEIAECRTSRLDDGVVVAMQDVTDRRVAAQMLAESEERYRILAENASDLVVMTSPDRVIRWVSPSLTRSLGWAVEDLMGKRLLDLAHPDDAAATAGPREGAYLGHAVTTPEGGFLMRLRSKSGQYRWMSGVATPVTDESGVVTGVVSGLRDVEDLVRAREEAQRLSSALKTSNDSLRDFVSVASHDLRSPLVTIGGFATILTHNWATLNDEDRLKYLGVIKRGVDRLSRLTNDLLTSAKVEGAAEQPRPEHIRLATALASYLEADREELGTVAVTCPPELVAVVDPVHLARILDNYVGNAFKYGEPPICVEAERVGDFVELRVRDHGPGVPPEFVSRLFTKFDRVDTPTTRATQGTGLGLSIVKALAEANHGDARYQQDEPNGGCFVVRLPADDA
jgi:PAS domain S-box-containing protein